MQSAATSQISQMTTLEDDRFFAVPVTDEQSGTLPSGEILN